MIKIVTDRKTTFLLMISLFYLIFMQVARADQMNVIAFHITNSGMYATIGVSSEPTPEQTFFIDQSTEPTLTCDPASIAFTDSPLKFFQTFWKHYGTKITELLNDDTHKALPIKVRIVAAGSKRAASKSAPEESTIGYYLRSYSREQTEACLKTQNKKQFFNCVFTAEIERWLPGRDITVDEIEEDTASIVKMAALYYAHQIKSAPGSEDKQLSDPETESVKSTDQQPLLVGHITTCSQFCSMDDHTDCRYRLLPYMNVFSHQNNYITFRIGDCFQQKHLKDFISSDSMQPVVESFKEQRQLRREGKKDQVKLDQDQFEQLLCKYQQQHADSLLSAVYSSSVLHQAAHIEPQKDQPMYDGAAPCMMCRLGVLGVGYVLFGDLVADTLYKQGNMPEMDKIKKTCPQYSSECACDQAMHLIENVIQSLLEEITSIGISFAEKNRSVEKQHQTIPSFMLIGDRINILEQYALKKDLSFSDILVQRLQNQGEVDKLVKQMRETIMCCNEQQFKEDIQNTIIPMIQKMIIVPKEKFTTLMHQVAQ
ncbi:MAG: hypothetical protein OXC48_08730 [Endozoicomonadaceae bacterium]|nr:hypothetical protein [Endozoicomonadaceae bacterium]